MKRFIALYGGSFNLPTKTHQDVGKAVRDQVKPDEVWYLVSPQNPHKSAVGMAEFHHRIEMARLNVAGEPGLVVTDIEKEIREKVGTQTADVLRELITRYPDSRFAWVMGADCFADLHTWGPDYTFILEHVPLIIMPRKGWTERALDSHAAHHPASRQLDHVDQLKTENGWVVLDFPEDDVSATASRAQVKQGVCPDSVRPEVYHYVMQNRLEF